MTVKVVRSDTGETLMVLEGEKLTDDTMELITEKGIEVDGDIRYFNPDTMKMVEVRDVICNKTDDCSNQECEHKDEHPENEMTDPCDDENGCGMSKDAKCVPVSSAVNVPKVRSEIEDTQPIHCKEHGVYLTVGHCPVCKEEGITESCEDAVLESEAKKLLADGLTKAKKYTEGITGPAIPPEVKHSVLEGLLQDYYEGNDICDLNLKKMMSKEMQYNAIVRQMLAFLECHENDDKPMPAKIVYDAKELDVMIEMVEKALKELESP